MILSTIMVAGFFLTIYFIYIPFLPAILVHIGYILLSSSFYWFLKKGHYRFVKFSMIIAHMIQLSLAVYVWFPDSTGFNIYYLMVPMVTFLVMNYDSVVEQGFAVGTSLLASFLFLISQVGTTSYMYPIHDSLGVFLESVSIMSILIPMTFIFQFFAKDLYVSHNRLEELANTDELTQLSNRRVLYENGSEAYYLAKKYNYDFTLLLFDIDHFKCINDQYGHPAGDRLLEALADLVMKNIRSGDTFARYGGEEFAILLRNTDRDKTTAFAIKLLNLVRTNVFHIETKEVGITISIGVAHYKNIYSDFDDIMKVADKALYQAKNSGRDQVVFAPIRSDLS